MNLIPNNTIYLNDTIAGFIDFDHSFKKSYPAELIEDGKIINVYFIIQKTNNLIEMYKSYLTLRNTTDLFHNDNSIKTINIKATDIPSIYKLKIYLDEYIFTILSIKINDDFCFNLSTTPEESKVYFNVLNKNKSELFTIEKINNKE